MALAHWAQQLPQPEHDPAEARDAARHILDGTQFQPPPQSLPDRLIEWGNEQIARLFDALAGGGGSPVIAWLVFGLIAGLVAFVVYRLTRGIQATPGLRVGETAAPRKSRVEWVAEAAAHEARGEWKQALRCRYRALIADLVERDLVRDVPGRTAGEYRGDVAESAPDLAASFGGATELFERAWYGDEPTGPPENGQFRSLAETVVRGAP
jgi:hypothetical protein